MLACAQVGLAPFCARVSWPASNALFFLLYRACERRYRSSYLPDVCTCSIYLQSLISSVRRMPRNDSAGHRLLHITTAGCVQSAAACMCSVLALPCAHVHVHAAPFLEVRPAAPCRHSYAVAASLFRTSSTIVPVIVCRPGLIWPNPTLITLLLAVNHDNWRVHCQWPKVLPNRGPVRHGSEAALLSQALLPVAHG